MPISRNSLVTYLTGYYRAALKDVAWLYTSQQRLERDLSRLSFELETRGPRVALLDLPALGKHFLKCLDQGVFTGGAQFLTGRCRKGVPAFLQDLFGRIFDTSGRLRDSPDPDAIQAIRLICEGAKKVRLPSDDRSIHHEINDFLAIEASMRRPSLDWDGGFDADCADGRGLQFYTASSGHQSAGDLFGDTVPQVSVSLARSLDTLHRVGDVVASLIGDLDYGTACHPKHGPGVTAEMRRYDDKYQLANWPETLELRYPACDYAASDFTHAQDMYSEGLLRNHCVASRLIDVPKTFNKPRLIAAEPAARQWIQQLIWAQLEEVLNTRLPIRASISFRDQTQNGDLARAGSKWGTHSTVDLSSASDRLSCWTVERLFRTNPDFLSRLAAARTRWIQVGSGPQKGYYLLKKFGTMGSAVTFPVQTIVYTCVAIACLLRNQVVNIHSIETAARQVSVFGDDIVIPSHATGDLMEVLEYLGLKVNRDKTFCTGKFRESCGTEWFDGHDVSIARLLEPPDVRGRLKATASTVSTRNNFYVKGFWNLAYWLESISDIPKDAVVARVGDEVPAILSFTEGRVARRVRWNRKLHRSEVKATLIVSKSSLAERAGRSSLFKWFLDEPPPEIRWKSGTSKAVEARWLPGWVPADKYSLTAVLRILA